MNITAIKVQVKNSERISFYIDEKYAFSLTYNQLLEQKLRVGLEVTEPRLAELRHISDFGKAYERALMYALLRPRSVRELRDYARRKKWAPEDAEVIIAKLVAKKYVDDAAFARSWVESRLLVGKTSKRKLQQELKQKGVSGLVIDAALDNANFDDTNALQQMIQKKRKLARYAQDDQKLMRYLVTQGFGFDDVKNALSH